MAEEIMQPKWLVDKLIPSAGITIISGDPGSYKTWLLMEIARCVSQGEKLFGTFDCTQGNVLVIDEENNTRLLKERYALLGVKADASIFLSIRNSFQVETDMDDLLNLVKEKQIKLVCIDSLVRIHGKEENVAGQMAEVFAFLSQLTALGVTVIMTHHLKKASAGTSNADLRGSSDILAAIDCHLAVRKTKLSSSLVISQSKMRVATEMSPISLSIGSDANKFQFAIDSFLEPEKSVHEQAIEQILGLLASGEISRKELVKSVTNLVGSNAVGRLLKKLVKDGSIQLIKEENGKHIYRLTKS